MSARGLTMRVVKMALVALMGLAVPVVLVACNGPGAQPYAKTVRMEGASTRVNLVDFGALAGVRIRLFNRFTERYTIEATGTTCEAAVAPARVRRTCSIRIRRNGGGGSLMSILVWETGRVLDHFFIQE